MLPNPLQWMPWFWPLPATGSETPDEPPPWASPNEITLAWSNVLLRRFGRPDPGRLPILIVAPYAIHGATVVDFAEGHSIVQRLQACGHTDIFVLEFLSATPELRFASVEDHLAALNIAVDELGGRARLVGLCQGGWLSLAYAARFPAKVERLVLVGAPVDLDACPSALVDSTRAASPESLAAVACSADGLVHGERMLAMFEQTSLQNSDLRSILQADRPDLAEAFERWNGSTLDLPGHYWAQTAEWIFRENRLARGCFRALGHDLDLADVRCPLFVLAGRDDGVTPPPQALAAARLVGTDRPHVHTAVAPCGHLALFLGARTLARDWKAIGSFLAKPLSRSSGSGAGPAGRRSARPAC